MAMLLALEVAMELLQKAMETMVLEIMMQIIVISMVLEKAVMQKENQ